VKSKNKLRTYLVQMTLDVRTKATNETTAAIRAGLVIRKRLKPLRAVKYLGIARLRSKEL